MTLSCVNLTVRGSQKTPNEECQDFSIAESLNEHVFILAVADGAGSRPASGHGARAVITTLREQSVARCQDLERCTEARHFRTLVEGIFRAAVQSCRESLPKHGGRPIGDYAATVGALICAPPLFGMCAIGDVWACVQRIGGSRCHLILPPERSHLFEQNASQTDGTIFFTSDDWEAEMFVAAVFDPGVRSALVSTDGLTDVAIGYTQPDVGSIYPRDVFLVPELFEAVRSGATAEAVAAGFSERSILEVKGDDIGVALAVW